MIDRIPTPGPRTPRKKKNKGGRPALTCASRHWTCGGKKEKKGRKERIRQRFLQFSICLHRVGRKKGKPSKAPTSGCMGKEEKERETWGSDLYLRHLIMIVLRGGEKGKAARGAYIRVC